MNCFLAYEYDTPLVSCMEACKFYCSANYVNCGEHVQQVVIVCPVLAYWLVWILLSREEELPELS